MEKKYQVTIRSHYGMDMHEYSHEEVDEKGLEELKKKYPHKNCPGHTYDTPLDDISKIEEIK